jgi:hypothetical protein
LHAAELLSQNKNEQWIAESETGLFLFRFGIQGEFTICKMELLLQVATLVAKLAIAGRAEGVRSGVMRLLTLNHMNLEVER